MRIIITAPIKKDKWTISFGSGNPRKSKDAVQAYRYLERRISRVLASRKEEKIKVRVNYGQGHYNESVASRDSKYLLCIGAVFLENYVSPTWLRGKEKMYG